MTTGISTFDKTIQRSNEWLKEIAAELESHDLEEAYSALHATLHALRDRLTLEEAAQLSAQLPLLIRGAFFEGWNPTGKPLRERHKEEFLGHIRRELRNRITLDPERAARAVFAVLARRVSAGEIEDVVSTLPHQVRELWPARV